MLMDYVRGGVKIQFDDFTFDPDDQLYWAEMCKKHAETYAPLLGGIDKVIDGVPYAPCCSVRGCENQPEVYIGFKKAEVEVYEGELLNRTGTMVGKITRRSTRYCAACASIRPCYIVRWPDGSVTKPCVHGCKSLGNNQEQIV